MLVKCPQCGFEKESNNKAAEAKCPKCGHRWVFDWKQRYRYMKEREEKNPEYGTNCRQYRNEWQQEHRNRNRKEIREVFGDKCFFCGRSRKETKMNLHKKNGESHPADSDWILKHKDEFVLLCVGGKGCHFGVHWCMDYLGFNWETIEQLFKSA